MKNKAIIILLFIVAGLFAALYIMGGFPFGNEPEELNIGDFSIKSNDESAILSIPNDALPDNVDIDEVSVTKASNIVTENGTWIVYNLEPDGLVFKEEVLFNVTLESANNTVPIVFISSSTGVELVNNTFIDNDLENNTQIVSIPLSHFSTIRIFYDTTTFSLKVSVPTSIFVGERLNTIASFSFKSSRLLLDTRMVNGIFVFDILDPRVRYEGTWENPGSIYEKKPLIPAGEFSGKPSSINVNIGQTNTVKDDTFKGNSLGKNYLFYTAEVSANVKYTHNNTESDYLAGKFDSSATDRNQKFVIRKRVWVKCITPELIIQSTRSTSFENNPESSLIAEIKGPPNKAGFVTLTGPGMDPMIQPLLLGPDGSTRIKFIHTFKGEVILLVEVGELTAERKINVG